jgi:hypothetical protein
METEMEFCVMKKTIFLTEVEAQIEIEQRFLRNRRKEKNFHFMMVLNGQSSGLNM